MSTLEDAPQRLEWGVVCCACKRLLETFLGEYENQDREWDHDAAELCKNSKRIYTLDQYIFHATACESSLGSLVLHLNHPGFFESQAKLKDEDFCQLGTKSFMDKDLPIGPESQTLKGASGEARELVEGV